VGVWNLLQKSVMITGFVAVMMLAVEYANVRTHGVVLRLLGESRWRQYVVAALLGATPGCLGAFALVALYAHGCVSLGALVAGMIATSGDEMFVMLALFPGAALAMTAGLALLGVAAGWAFDRLARVEPGVPSCGFDLHQRQDCRCFPRELLLSQWRPPSPHRALLTVVLLLLVIGLAVGALGPAAWGWKRVTLVAVVSTGLFIVATVPDHFLDEHLWRHVALKHAPRIFAWTLGTLGVLAALERLVDLRALVSAHRFAVLAFAGLLGIVPESGPHLLFVNLYAEGAVPLSVLVASSVVQDGHGMLPLLAHSRADFLRVKLANLVVGMAVGAAMLAIGR
jgi:hypothetical protein